MEEKMQQSERSAFFTPICELPPIPGRKENCSDPVLMRQLRDLQKDRCEISHAGHVQQLTHFAF